jgi:hypothetical protein
MTSFALGWYDLQNIKVCPLNMIMNFCLVWINKTTLNKN